MRTWIHVAIVVGGWVILAVVEWASDRGHLPAWPDRLDRVAVAAFIAITVAVVVIRALRVYVSYQALKLGREIETEQRRRRRPREYPDLTEDTSGNILATGLRP